MITKAKSTLSNDNGQKRLKNRIKRELQEQTYVENQNRTFFKKSKEKHQYKSNFTKFYEFKEAPKKIFSAILKKCSSEQKGYSVLKSGQQVTVEYFGEDHLLRVTAMDGRQGVTNYNNIKPLFSCTRNK